MIRLSKDVVILTQQEYRQLGTRPLTLSFADATQPGHTRLIELGVLGNGAAPPTVPPPLLGARRAGGRRYRKFSAADRAKFVAGFKAAPNKMEYADTVGIRVTQLRRWSDEEKTPRKPVGGTRGKGTRRQFTPEQKRDYAKQFLAAPKKNEFARKVGIHVSLLREWSHGRRLGVTGGPGHKKNNKT